MNERLRGAVSVSARWSTVGTPHRIAILVSSEQCGLYRRPFFTFERVLRSADYYCVQHVLLAWPIYIMVRPVRYLEHVIVGTSMRFAAK